ncbi:MAG TPA: NAD-dependent epimerase/dehydratase family protein [Polyangia bacterium]|nr:NAD-dependent epimerase/dehydratase family protein [Polyangia bacterium]
MKILLTGGAGFIGSHLAERLLATGHDVICLDNFNDFYDPAIKQRNIERALASPGYTLVTGDILDRELLDRIFDRHCGIDCVAHLAAYAGVRPSIERPEIYQRVNIEGTLNLLERARIYEVKRFVFASSSSVYGGRTEVPFRETDDVMRPISPYAATKVAGEALCYTYHHLFGLSAHVLRFFTVYGPRQRPEMAIHLFASKLRRGEPVRIFGDGRSSRDYTYIDDIVAGVHASIERCSGFEVLNLGGSRTTSLEDLIALLARRLGVTPVVEREPDQPGDVPVTFADISAALRILDYRPQVGIEAGIDRFCSWLEKNRREE